MTAIRIHDLRGPLGERYTFTLGFGAAAKMVFRLLLLILNLGLLNNSMSLCQKVLLREESVMEAF